MNKQEIYNIQCFFGIDRVDWNNVSKANIDNYQWGSSSKYKAYAQMVRLNNFGYAVKMVSFESNPWATHLSNGDAVYLDSALEAFLCFDGVHYINIECNSKGYTLQGFGVERHNRTSLFDIDLAFDVKVENFSDRWEVTILLPFDKLVAIYKGLNPSICNSGALIKGNFYKTGKEPVTGEEHYNTWKYISNETPDFHRPEQFGDLIVL